MKRVLLAMTVLLAVVFGIAVAGEGAEVTLRSLPPVVVKTVPAAGETGVSPETTREIRVTFSKKMKKDGWSWVVVSPRSWPGLRGKPRFQPDGKTCVLPVALEPRTTYALWINSEQFHGFQDRQGHPAVPYLLVFRTGRR